MPDAMPYDAVAAATRLAPHIRAGREELETTCRVPISLVQAMHDAGLFRPYLPRALGGRELPRRAGGNSHGGGGNDQRGKAGSG